MNTSYTNCSTIFKFKEVTIDEIQIIIQKLNNKSDFNNLNINILADSMDIIGDIFIDIINESLKTGLFPTSWKNSIIVPIQKITGTKLCHEFRPINTLPNHEKVLEL